MNELVLLAGGIGSRLNAELNGLPKVLAPVGGHPFVDILLRYYISKGFNRFIFSLGYQHELVIRHLEEYHAELQMQFVIDPYPLGTGGALVNAMTNCTGENVFVINADTYFEIDVASALAFHHAHCGECTIILKQMEDCSRYGAVKTDIAGRVVGFVEKGDNGPGYINGGAYVFNKTMFCADMPTAPFSLEKDYLTAGYREKIFFGLPQDGFFIDIGIPEDLERANKEIRT